MKVLVACEESQRVCIAFRKKGHEAYSCDRLKCSGGHPEWHIKKNVLTLLNGDVWFYTCDNIFHFVDKWDLIIAHPPCTRLCATGQRWLYFGSEEYQKQKREEQKDAIEFFMAFVKAKCDKIAIENPVGIMSTLYRKPDCIYNPYDFTGETEAKKTCLWLKGLPPLKSTRITPINKSDITHGIFEGKFSGKQYPWGSSECSRLRSQTPIGVAQAMAEQWG